MALALAMSILGFPIVSPTPAFAQAPPDVRPPVVQGDTAVPYPANAEGNATVLMDLVVDKDGSVSSAVVVEGGEPFAERARGAALAWRFTPARRGETPVAARIRARVEFQQPPPKTTAAPLTPLPG